jgi:hypothetical protein
MLILSGALDDARAAFGKALALDPLLELDPAYRSPTIEGLWNEAKKKAAQTGGGGDMGGFLHVPPAAQLVRAPVPIYVEYTGPEKVQRIVAKYRGAGVTEWKAIELKKLGNGYGGLIPCRDVTEGVMYYFVEGHGASERPIAGSGNRVKPHAVQIKRELTGPAPSLPGQEPPKQCVEGSSGETKAAGEDCKNHGECQSGACAGGKCIERKGEGNTCQSPAECAGGLCSDGKCTTQKRQADEPCNTDGDCASGTCAEGKCGAAAAEHPSAPRVRKIWIGLAASLDVVLLPTARDLCVLSPDLKSSLNSAGYRCVDPGNGANFPGDATTNASIVKKIGDSVGTGGFVPGNLRLLASVDYAIATDMLLGARAGFVLFTYPGSNPGPAFAPIHLEARFTYLFGKDALTRALMPMAFLAAGASEFDASIGVPLLTTSGAKKNENAWLTAGPMFVAAGAGVRLLVGPRSALTAAIKAQGAFGGSAGLLFGFAPEVGVQFGL